MIERHVKNCGGGDTSKDYLGANLILTKMTLTSNTCHSGIYFDNQLLINKNLQQKPDIKIGYITIM